MKKHELVMADVESFDATIASLDEQSKNCKVCACLCVCVSVCLC